jgi:hypothetical protein
MGLLGDLLVDVYWTIFQIPQGDLWPRGAVDFLEGKRFHVIRDTQAGFGPDEQLFFKAFGFEDCHEGFGKGVVVRIGRAGLMLGVILKAANRA